MPRTFKSSGRPDGPALRAALERLDRLVDWERRERVDASGRLMRVGLEPAFDLMARLGDPQRAFLAVHVAGTKGKGSVAALVAAGMRRTGARVGVYGSPHVEHVTERVVLDGAPVAPEPFARTLEQALDAHEAATRDGSDAARATWFDVLTAAAFTLFAEARPDLVVVECGLGGRLDSTNVLPPGGSVITNVDLEHTAILGDTRAAIAAEKAGIVKPGGWVVSGVGPDGDPAADVVRDVALARGARWIPVAVPAGATLESENVIAAGAVLDELGGGALAAFRAGDRAPGAWLLDRETRDAARLPGRLEHLSFAGVPVVLDGAHVASSMQAVLDELAADPRSPGTPVVVLGLGSEKDARGILKVLRGRVDRVLCTSVGAGPYRDPGELLGEARGVGLVAEKVTVPQAAFDRAVSVARPGGWVLVTGSLHLIGSLRAYVEGRSAC